MSDTVSAVRSIGGIHVRLQQLHEVMQPRDYWWSLAELSAALAKRQSAWPLASLLETLRYLQSMGVVERREEGDAWKLR